MHKLQNAFETLILQREEFTKLIHEDDEEFEAQEAWLEESKGFFMNFETDINLYLDSKEDVQSNLLANDKESLSSENLNKSNTHSGLSVESNNMSDS